MRTWNKQAIQNPADHFRAPWACEIAFLDMQKVTSTTQKRKYNNVSKRRTRQHRELPLVLLCAFYVWSVPHLTRLRQQPTPIFEPLARNFAPITPFASHI